jgi:DNA repair exonuclease SbcCD ATPase subunit
MKILLMELYNVGSFKGKLKIRFDKQGIVSLQGKQGTGKTTILNALAFGLFNTILKSDKKILVGDIQNWYTPKSEGFYVKILFKVPNDNTLYRTINSRNHPIYGSAFRLQKKKEGKYYDISDNSDLTKINVEELIGCDYTTFTNSVYIRQNSVSSLLGRPADRLKIFLRLIGLEEKFNQLDKELREMESDSNLELEKSKSKLEGLSNNEITNISVLLEKENLVSIFLLNSFEKLRKVNHDLRVLKRREKQLFYWINEYESIGDKLDNIQNLIKSAEKEIYSSNQMIKTLDFSKGRELNSLDVLLEEKKELEEKRSEISSEMDSLLDIRNEVRITKARLSNYEEKFITLTSEIRQTKRDLTDLKNEVIEDKCRACGQYLPENRVREIEKELEKEIESVKKELEDKKDDLEVVGNDVNKYKELVKELEGKEKRWILLRHDLQDVDRRLEKLEDVSENKVVDKYNKDINVQKIKIKRKKEEVSNYKIMVMDLNRESKKVENKLTEYGELEEILDTMFEEDIRVKDTEKTKLWRKYSDFNHQLITIKTKIDDYFEVMEKFERVKLEVKEKELGYNSIKFLRKTLKSYRFQIIDNYLESINYRMNKFLQVFDFPYSVARFDLSGNNSLDWVFYNGIEWKDVVNLSGGETQTLLLSGIFSFFKVLSSSSVSNCIFCDEPLSGLDIEHQEIFFKFLEDFVSKDMLVVISSHSTVILEEHFSEIWKMEKRGKDSILTILGGNDD